VVRRETVARTGKGKNTYLSKNWVKMGGGQGRKNRHLIPIEFKKKTTEAERSKNNTWSEDRPWKQKKRF